MVTPNPAPTNGRPSDSEEGASSPATNQPAASATNETQSQLATSDGAGIRGDYGDADQTNGLEGGDEQPADAAPDRADHNPTNAPQQ